jgi:hypothetical protein
MSAPMRVPPNVRHVSASTAPEVPVWGRGKNVFVCTPAPARAPSPLFPGWRAPAPGSVRGPFVVVPVPALLSPHYQALTPGRREGRKRPEAREGREGDPAGSPTDRLGEVVERARLPPRRPDNH